MNQISTKSEKTQWLFQSLSLSPSFVQPFRLSLFLFLFGFVSGNLFPTFFSQNFSSFSVLIGFECIDILEIFLYRKGSAKSRRSAGQGHVAEDSAAPHGRGLCDADRKGFAPSGGVLGKGAARAQKGAGLACEATASRLASAHAEQAVAPNRKAVKEGGPSEPWRPLRNFGRCFASADHTMLQTSFVPTATPEQAVAVDTQEPLRGGLTTSLRPFRSFKIGILFGFFVDAFKVGS